MELEEKIRFLDALRTAEEKAALWDALMSSERVRVLGYGSDGIDKDTPIHIGVEFTAHHPTMTNSDTRSREIFLKYVKSLIPK